jgi:outer membrane protein assembly factor BamB
LASWTAPFYNFGDTAYNPKETVLGSSNVASLSQHSSYLYPTSALGLSNILSVGTTIYSEYDTKDASGHYFEHVTAIKPATGAVRWTSSSPVATNIDFPDVGQPGPIAIKSGVIYASAYDHLDAINASTGAILWSYTPQAPQQSGDLAFQAVANGVVYIRDGNAQAPCFGHTRRPRTSKTRSMQVVSSTSATVTEASTPSTRPPVPRSGCTTALARRSSRSQTASSTSSF